jgi:predicted acylesterase/phospholipase RssA
MENQQYSQAVSDALRILAGEDQVPRKSLKLAKTLKREQQFSFARRVLGRARKKPIDDPDLELELVQQHALCTYKDPDTPRHDALESAWNILSEGADLDHTDVRETLGIAGAICKRQFELADQRHYLEKSLHYYERGYHSNHEQPDFGYNGINAAFVHDYLAFLEDKIVKNSKAAEKHSDAAREIRTHLLTDMDKQVEDSLEENSNWDPRTEWWLPATLAEACLGLALGAGEGAEADKFFAQAREHLAMAAGLENISEWERQSTATQLSRLSWLHIACLPENDHDSAYERVGKVFTPLIGADARTDFAEKLIGSLLQGKVGLALSGGGFRASLFHLGVLAQLAELDVLRHVQVLSCVSGGSIVGAHYYLELQELLTRTPDEKISQDDYLQLVDRVAKQFLAGVQRNVRTRVFSNLLENLKMIFSLKSRTLRLGELFEEEIYSRVGDGKGQRPRYMSDLICKPSGSAGDFKPRRDNWRRVNKVPDLIFNATTLNTGHNWQFTASWMGEPPETVDPEVDANERLRRLYYYQAPDRFRQVRLGTAVGASACVPGLFEPVSLSGLYDRRQANTGSGPSAYDVELVDGGVHDNQGVAALLGQDCDVVLVSDASGQMDTDVSPKDSAMPVLLRANSVLMKRVRTAEYEDLVAKHQSGRLRGLMFIHLRSDLDPDPEDWANCQDPWEARDDARPPERRGPVTRYGVLRKVQDRLSSLRTDLDSFSDKEAMSLMLSGYRLTEKAFSDGIADLPKTRLVDRDWEFKRLDALVMDPNADTAVREGFIRLLDIGRYRGFKIWRMERGLKAIALAAGAVGLLLILFLAFGELSFTLLSSKTVALMILTFLVTVLVGKWAARVLNYESTAWKAIIGVMATFVGTAGSWLHLKFFDSRFLGLGKVGGQRVDDADDHGSKLA